MSVYSTVPLKRPKRSAHNLTHSCMTTLKTGVITPTSVPLEMVPGDTLDFSQLQTVELMPLVSPFKGDLFLESFCFFVSNDLVYDEDNDEAKFSDILLSVNDPDNPIPLPCYDYYTDPSESTSEDTIWNRFGSPKLTGNVTKSLNVIPYPYRAYNLFYNEYVRDENLQEEVDINNHKLLNINYKKDRFTSAFTSPQKGNAIPLPLTGLAHADFTNVVTPNVLASATFPHVMIDSTDQKIGSSTRDTAETLVNALNKNTIDMSTVSTFTIEDLRLINKLQKWQERLQLCGSRYKEYLLANYGTCPNDETLQRPVLIGHIKTPVIVNSVIQNNPSESTETGNKVGNGVGSAATHFGRWTAKEFGYVLIVSVLRPYASYHQGISRQLIKENVYDFYNPIFQGLGQEEIYTGELYFTGSENDKKTFGYTDRYNSMRHIENITTGELNGSDSLTTWSVKRTFAEEPTLEERFIQVLPEEYDYLFAIPSTTKGSAHAVLTTTNVIKAIRPLSKFAMTSL